MHQDQGWDTGLPENAAQTSSSTNEANDFQFILFQKLGVFPEVSLEDGPVSLHCHGSGVQAQGLDEFHQVRCIYGMTFSVHYHHTYSKNSESPGSNTNLFAWQPSRNRYD